MRIKIKSFFLCHIVLIVIVAFLGQLGKAQMPKCGIEKVRTMEQIYELEIDATAILEDADYESFVEYKEDYINDVKDAPIVAIVKPTGNVRAYNLSFDHEVKVEKIIKGEEELENKIVQIYDAPVFAVNEMNHTRLEYRDIKNLMQLGHTYLAFFSPIELNEFSEENVYRFDESFFNYLDIGHDNTSDVMESSEKVNFNEKREIEFFASSQRMLDVLMEIKQKIVEKYI